MKQTMRFFRALIGFLLVISCLWGCADKEFALKKPEKESSAETEAKAAPEKNYQGELRFEVNGDGLICGSPADYDISFAVEGIGFSAAEYFRDAQSYVDQMNALLRERFCYKAVTALSLKNTVCSFYSTYDNAPGTISFCAYDSDTVFLSYGASCGHPESTSLVQFGINGVALSDSFDEIVRLFGEPLKKEPFACPIHCGAGEELCGDNSNYLYTYEFTDGSVITFVTVEDNTLINAAFKLAGESDGADDGASPSDSVFFQGSVYKSSDEIRDFVGVSNAFELVYAFLTGDGDALNSRMGASQRDYYKKLPMLAFSDISISCVSVSPVRLVFNFTVSESMWEYLGAGEYSYEVNDGPTVGTVWRKSGSADFLSSSEAARAVNYVQAYSLDSGVDNISAHAVTDYIFAYLRKNCPEQSDPALSPSQMAEYALRFFGMENFVPPENEVIVSQDGLYRGTGHGGLHSTSEICDVREAADGIHVTVQYYAEVLHVVPSCTVEYTVQRLSDDEFDFRFADVRLVSDTGEQAFYWQT